VSWPEALVYIVAIIATAFFMWVIFND